MTPQDMQALESFLTQLVQASAGAKDPQAEARIAEAVARQPDAAYLLVQRAMLLDHALASAKTQIASLQNQVQALQAGASNSFLDPQNAWGNSAGRAAPAQPMPPAQPAAVPQQPQAIPAQASRPGFLSGGLGSTLGSIATTAAGVAGGAFLFQGIENLFHRNSGGGFLGQPAMGALPTETTVVNNYYDDGGRAGFDGRDGGSGFLSDGGLSDGLGDDDFMNDDSSII